MSAVGVTVQSKMDELLELSERIPDESIREAIAKIASDAIDVAEEEREYAFEQGRQEGWSEGYDEGYDSGRDSGYEDGYSSSGG